MTMQPLANTAYCTHPSTRALPDAEADSDDAGLRPMMHTR